MQTLKNYGFLNISREAKIQTISKNGKSEFPYTKKLWENTNIPKVWVS